MLVYFNESQTWCFFVHLDLTCFKMLHVAVAHVPKKWQVITCMNLITFHYNLTFLGTFGSFTDTWIEIYFENLIRKKHSGS